MPYLAFNLNDGNEFIFDLLEERLSLGRNPGNEIVIDNNQISSFHAEFARQPSGAYLLTDLKSSNGTYVNGDRVESAELKPGDRVRFGQFEARFRDRFIPGRGRERKGPGPSAEEKRRAAESSGEPGSRTDFIPLADKAEEADAVRVGTANGRPIASASHNGAVGSATPKPAAAERQFAERQSGLQQSQASKIQEFDATFAAKLSAIEIADGRLRELEARRADLETKTAELAETERKFADLRNEISGHESKRADLAGLIKALATERGAHEAEIGALSAERERRETGLGELAARERELRNSAGMLQKETEAARARLDELRKLNEEAEQNLSTRQIDLARAVAEKESYLRSLEERIAQLAPLGEEFAVKQRVLSATDSRLQDATKALSLLEVQKDALERTIASQTRQREEKEREIAGLDGKCAAQHTLLQTLSKQIARFEESVAIRRRRVEAANAYLAGIDSRAAEIEAKSAAHQTELENARTAVAQAEAKLESLRNEIQAAASAKGKLLAEQDEERSRLQALTELLADSALHRQGTNARAAVAEEGEGTR